MSVTTQRRLVNPRLGTYFGIFASCLAALVLLLLILEQLGASGRVLSAAMLLGPLTLFCAIGIAARCRDTGDFFTAGRRVPAGGGSDQDRRQRCGYSD